MRTKSLKIISKAKNTSSGPLTSSGNVQNYECERHHKTKLQDIRRCPVKDECSYSTLDS